MTTLFLVICLIFLLGCFGGGAIAYSIYQKKIKLPQIKRNEEIEKENEHLELKNKELINSKEILNQQIQEETEKLYDTYEKINEATFKVDSVKEEAKQAKEEFLKSNLEVAQNALDRSLEKISEEYQQAENEYKKEYLAAMAEMTYQAQEEFLNKQNEVGNLEAKSLELSVQIDDLCKTINTIVESKKRAEADIKQKDFYRLILPKEDKEEIEILKTITPKLRDPSALNKVIWKVYYEKPYTALVGRVIGAAAKTGIYKITNLENGMSYIGQAINVAERWRQHIKRGLGAEAPSRNKLYPAMAEFGVENFMFELLEECPAQKLNEKEDYYQEVFHCKDYGYSIK